jgi:hypothetical protein
MMYSQNIVLLMVLLTCCPTMPTWFPAPSKGSTTSVLPIEARPHHGGLIENIMRLSGGVGSPAPPRGLLTVTETNIGFRRRFDHHNGDSGARFGSGESSAGYSLPGVGVSGGTGGQNRRKQMWEISAELQVWMETHRSADTRIFSTFSRAVDLTGLVEN